MARDIWRFDRQFSRFCLPSIACGRFITFNRLKMLVWQKWPAFSPGIKPEGYNENFGGDPAPGSSKRLTVRYRINGRTGQATFSENDFIVLPIPHKSVVLSR